MRKLLLLLYFVSLSTFAAEPQFFQTPKDKIPNYTRTPTITSIASGDWSSTSTWSCTCIPTTGDVVKIEPAHTVTYNVFSAAELNALGIEGALVFDHTLNTKLHAGTITVYRAGRLDIGTSTNPIASDKTAEIVFNDTAIDTNFDPSQYGIGLLVLGEINVYGKDIGKTWSRQTSNVLATQNAVTVEDDISNWYANSKIVFPDSRQIIIERQWSSQPMEEAVLNVEEKNISSISASTITLASALAYDHKGVSSNDNTFVKYPHVANLTRNVRFSSENGAGTRAHVLVTERAKADIRFASFTNMGRTTAEPLDSSTFDSEGNIAHVGTNQIGRYPLHLHHHMGPVNATNTGYQFYVIGNAFDDCEKWCFSAHNSHYGKIDNNVGHKATGSIYMTEQGNEFHNEITNNFAVLAGTPFVNWYKPIYGGVTRTAGGLEWHDFGWEGTGFWLTGPYNFVTGNVSATNAYSGLMLNARSPSEFATHRPLLPKYRGADINDASAWTLTAIDEWAPPIVEMKDNEVYASADCIWISFSGDVGTIENTDAWNCSQTGIYTTRNLRAHYINLRIVNDYATTSQAYHGNPILGIDMHNFNYLAGRNSFDGFLVEGFMIGVKLPPFIQQEQPAFGIQPPQNTLLENGKLRNFVDVFDYVPFQGHNKNTIINNTVFERITGYPAVIGVSDTSEEIKTYVHNSFSLTTKMKLSTLTINDYNGTVDDSFKVFFPEQDPDYLIPTQTNYTQDDCPTTGKTNTECQALHGVSLLGEVATCSDTTTRPNIIGFTCNIGAPPSGGPIVVDAGADVTINEGDTVTKTVAISGGTGTGRTYSINWDDGTAAEIGSINDMDSSITISRSYADGADSHNVTVDIDDDGSNNSSDGFSVTVNNINPSGSVIGTGSALINQSYTITTTISDPGADTITAYIVDWGDGGAAETITAGNPLTHTYTDSCSYAISVSVVDEDGTHFIGTHDVNVTCACGQ